MRLRVGLVLLLCAAVIACLVTACAGSSPQPGPPSSGPPVGEATASSRAGAQRNPQPPSDPTTTRPRSPTTRPTVAWRVGAKPLPLRPDGFGKVLPTPAALRDRRLPTVDRLPPPPGGRFRSAIRPISAAVRERMGRPGGPAARPG